MYCNASFLMWLRLKSVTLFYIWLFINSYPFVKLSAERASFLVPFIYIDWLKLSLLTFIQQWFFILAIFKCSMQYGWLLKSTMMRIQYMYCNVWISTGICYGANKYIWWFGNCRFMHTTPCREFKLFIMNKKQDKKLSGIFINNYNNLL